MTSPRPLVEEARQRRLETPAGFVTGLAALLNQRGCGLAALLNQRTDR
jgi:hypothetical protein